MNEYNSNDLLANADVPAETLPTTLNVLTILTFIGSALVIIWSLISPLVTGFLMKLMDKSAGQEMSASQMEKMEKGRHAMELVQANMVPLVIIGLIGGILCLAGAIMMRKRKKDGFWLYVAGQVVPIAGNFILLGNAQFTSVWSYIFLLIPIAFIVLYAGQRKYMTK